MKIMIYEGAKLKQTRRTAAAVNLRLETLGKSDAVQFFNLFIFPICVPKQRRRLIIDTRPD